MFPLEEITHTTCTGYQDQHPHTILYNILSGKESGYLNTKLNHHATAHNCHCEQRRTVCLKYPKATCQVASSVLVKTICFVRSLPSFSQLPSGDQSLLLRHCWVPLFLLGLAQEKIVFEVTDEPNSSILRQILLGPQLTERKADRPTLAGVHKLRTCLHHIWDLDLSPKEYAYLKGALLFNPAVHGLSALLLIRRPPTGSSESSPRDHPWPAPRRHCFLRPRPPSSLHHSDCQPQPGHRALLQACYRQHKYVTFINRHAVCAIRSE
ncbi:Nuclear receptor subfamily 0 group B member 2 [Larimichthys crocea]|uniref:Uncharacterized protein n=1 Tax=Larimichthys crocea TaxID=215358 RepID=A0ACD3RG40_LARCR|nr:Nuclear receptor subfamily 0 group B member 2 [Larimichthys crocea]